MFSTKHEIFIIFTLATLNYCCYDTKIPGIQRYLNFPHHFLVKPWFSIQNSQYCWLKMANKWWQHPKDGVIHLSINWYNNTHYIFPFNWKKIFRSHNSYYKNSTAKTVNNFLSLFYTDTFPPNKKSTVHENTAVIADTKCPTGRIAMIWWICIR